MLDGGQAIGTGLSVVRCAVGRGNGGCHPPFSWVPVIRSGQAGKWAEEFTSEIEGRQFTNYVHLDGYLEYVA